MTPSWTYPTAFNACDYAGFTYLITNTLTGRQYVGRKYFTSIRGKGKKAVTRESDWKRYWGSSTDLKADIKAIGVQHFTREILKLCTTKAETNYEEVVEQCARDVIRAKLPDGSPAFYNANILGRYYRSSF